MTNENEQTAVVLFSGGIDSTITLEQAIEENDTIYPVFIEYGQNHLVPERKASKEIVKIRQLVKEETDGSLEDVEIFGVDYKLFDKEADSGLLGGENGFTGTDEEGVHNAFVPARNTLMISHAYAVAEIVDADRIYVGFNGDDAEAFPDCTKDFIDSIQRTMTLGSRQPDKEYEVVAPLYDKSKYEIGEYAAELGVNPVFLALSHSAYDEDEEDDAENLRQDVFEGFRDAQ